MTQTSNIDLNSLSEQELEKLITQSRQQIKKLKSRQAAQLDSRDPDVVEVADAVRALAKAKKVAPAVAVTAVAKNMRVGLSAKRKPRKQGEVKYRHPQDPSKTWKGFGKRPLWLAEELEKGRSLDDFRVG